MECGRFLSVRLPIPVEGPFSSKMQTHKMKISRFLHIAPGFFGEYNVFANRAGHFLQVFSYFQRNPRSTGIIHRTF